MRRYSIAVALCCLAVVQPVSAFEATSATADRWSAHAQATLVWQGYPGFHAPFSGTNSLPPHSQDKETADITLYFGARLMDGLAFYVNPEADQGFGLSNTLGAAGFTSGEAYKVGSYHPYFRLQRAFFRYVANLGGEVELDQAEANQLGGSHTHDHVTITLGKFAASDLFDTNKYAHDPRSDFLNWSVVEAGAYDYAADAWGYSYGMALEWTRSWWTLRAGAFDLSRVPNSTHLVRGFGQFEVVAEAEERHAWWRRPGTVKLLVFANRGNMGSYGDALALGRQTDTPPDVALVRRYHTRPGAGLNLQQELSPDLGIFFRASLNNGNEETFEFTDINRSLSGGLSIHGSQWARPDDVIALAGVVNGISPAAKRYFAAGGLGVLVGDGRLPRYGTEKILETYYSWSIVSGATVSLDYQFVDNPAYDPSRGPVSVFALRLHAAF